MKITNRLLASVCAITTLPIIGPSPASGAILEEIVVTARKRVERLQDVPVVIQVFSAEEITRFAASNLSEISDLATQVEVYPASGGTGAEISIRGIGWGSADAGIEGSVGINIDGVQTDRGQITRSSFFDLESIQILKGPQAVLFGKNSPAGVIAVTSARPTDTFQARLQTGYEFESDEIIGEFMVSGPLTDTLRGRLAYRGSDSDGFLDNNAGFTENSNGEVLPTEPFDFPGASSDIGEEENHAVRLSLDWAPTEDFTAKLRTTYNDYESNGVQWGESKSCADGRKVPQVYSIVGPIPDTFGDCRLNGEATKGSVPREIVEAYSRDVGNGDPWNTYEAWLTSLQLEWELGDFTLSSVTGLYDYVYEHFDVFDMSSYATINGFANEEQQTISQEFRVLSQFSGALNFMVGGFYETLERDRDGSTKIAAIGLDPITGFSNTVNTFSDIDSETWSIFGQLIWNISDQLEFTVGARYTEDDKEMSQAHTYVHAFLAPLFSEAGRIIEGDYDDSHVSPEVTLSWQPRDIGTIYGAYRTGYKSGGFSTNSIITASATSDSLTFEPEESEGFEVGYKGVLMDGRLRVNASAYYYEFDDLQVSLFNPAIISFDIENAAAAETTGIDLELDYAATDTLLLRAAWGYNIAEYDDYATANCYEGQVDGCSFDPEVGRNVQELSGEELPSAPRNSGTLAFDFVLPIANNLEFNLSAEAKYTDEMQLNQNTNPFGVQDSFWRYNARLGVAAADGRWDVSFIGRNLSDELYQANNYVLPGSPATQDIFGQNIRGRQMIVQLTYNFGD